MNRERTLLQKIMEANEAINKTRVELDSFRTLQISEQAAIPRRLEALRDEVAFVERREREAQETYRKQKEEFDSLA